MMSQFFMVVDECLRDTGYIRFGAYCELMLYVVSFKSTRDADSCGLEPGRARGNIEHSRLIVP